MRHMHGSHEKEGHQQASCMQLHGVHFSSRTGVCRNVVNCRARLKQQVTALSEPCKHPKIHAALMTWQVPVISAAVLLAVHLPLLQFGVQHQLSRYRNMEGPMEIDIPLNVEVPFTWEFDGFGNTFCYVDGRLKHNWGDDECMPPFNVLLQNRRNHTLKVVRKVRAGRARLEGHSCRDVTSIWPLGSASSHPHPY